MDFNDIYEIEDETERIKKTYEIFNEDTRLNHSKAARVEFLTNVRYIEKYLRPSARILDIGAGAGEYSIYFARKGHEVSAIELSENNIKAFKRKITPSDKIDLVQGGNALDLSRYEDNSFDIVLLFGPLYHLKNNEDKQKCIAEAKRVCKTNGKIFFLPLFQMIWLYLQSFLIMTIILLMEIMINKHFVWRIFHLCFIQ